MIGLDAYSKQVSIYLDPILIYISLPPTFFLMNVFIALEGSHFWFYIWFDWLFEIRKIAVCFPWLLMPGDYRVTDEALLAETT